MLGKWPKYRHVFVQSMGFTPKRVQFSIAIETWTQKKGAVCQKITSSLDRFLGNPSPSIAYTLAALILTNHLAVILSHPHRYLDLDQERSYPQLPRLELCLWLHSVHPV